MAAVMDSEPTKGRATPYKKPSSASSGSESERKGESRPNVDILKGSLSGKTVVMLSDGAENCPSGLT